MYPVSFLMACMVAYIRAYRYKRFLKKTQDHTKDNTTTRGIRGKFVAASIITDWSLLSEKFYLSVLFI